MEKVVKAWLISTLLYEPVQSRSSSVQVLSQNVLLYTY